jgi:hypothetical protein
MGKPASPGEEGGGMKAMTASLQRPAVAWTLGLLAYAIWLYNGHGLPAVFRLAVATAMVLANLWLFLDLGRPALQTLGIAAIAIAASVAGYYVASPKLVVLCLLPVLAVYMSIGLHRLFRT